MVAITLFLNYTAMCFSREFALIVKTKNCDSVQVIVLHGNDDLTLT